MELYDRLKELRAVNRYKQKDIAEALHINPRTYSHYESGYRKISVEALVKLADFYCLSLDELIGRDLKKSVDNVPQHGVLSISVRKTQHKHRGG